MALKSSKTILGRKAAPSAHVQKLFADTPVGKQDDKQVSAVLFTDIVGSTAFFEQRGDEAGMAMVERHNALLFPIIDKHGGRVIKTIGDAIMAAFEHAADAVQASVGMQAELKGYNAQQESADQIRVRIGINYGEVICLDADLFGDVVNAAARVESLARGDQILVSAHVAAELDEGFPFPRHLYDAVRVRGKQEPMEIYRVDWDPDASAEDASPVPPVKIGQKLGERFEILELLGEGGMGLVVRAKDLALDEDVALKFMRPDLLSAPETLKRFKSEVRLARSVTHPHICRIHEFLEMGGHSFLSMELVRGVTLEDELLKKKLIEPAEVEHILAGVCLALQAAHEKGITHRDLKPANIMIEDDSSRIVLMDFGIAELSQGHADQNDGRVAGTPDYMSPEQVRGESLGPGSDIYSLGVILYQLLSGQPPHQASTPMAVAIQHVTAEPMPLAERRPGLPEKLLRATARCLAKEPTNRFESAADLGRFVLGDAYGQIQIIKRRPILPLAIGLTVLLALGLLALWFGLRDTAPAAAKLTELLVASDAVAHSARYAPDGHAIAFIQEGELWLLDGEQERPLTNNAEALESMDLSGLAWSLDGSLVFTAHGKTQPALKRLPPGASQAAVLCPDAAAVDLSPDGKQIVFSRRNSLGSQSVLVSQTDGSQEMTVMEGSASLSYLRPRWSPDGKKLALVVHLLGYKSTRDIAVLNLASGNLRMLTKDGVKMHAENTDPTWAPGGEWIAYASRRSGTSSLWWVPSEGGPSRPLSQSATEDQRHPDIAKDGQRVLFHTLVKQLDIELVYIEQKAGRPLTQKRRPDRFPSFSPDGQKVAYRSEGTGKHLDQHRIVVMDLLTNKRRPSSAPRGMRDFAFCGPEQMVFSATRGEDRLLGLLDKKGDEKILVDDFHRLWSPLCSPDAKAIVFVGQKQRSDARILWLYEIEKAKLQQLTQTGGLHSYPSWSPSGAKLAYRWAPSKARLGESELRLLDGVKVGSKPRKLTTDLSFRGSRRRLRFSGDGAWIYYIQAASEGGRLWRMPVKGGNPEKVLDLPYVHTFDFDISPDGKTLVYARANSSGNLHEARNPDWDL